MRRRTRMVVCILAAVTVAVGGTVIFREIQTRRQVGVLNAEAVKKQDALRAEFQRLGELTAKAERDVADLSARLAELQKREAPEPRRPRPPSLEQLLEFDPELKPVWDKRVRAQQEGAWAPLFFKLTLSGEDQEAFLRLYNEYSERSGDIVRSAEAQQMDLKHPAIEALFKQEIARTRELMDARFGKERSAQMYEHWRTRGPRQFADALAARVAFAAPLSLGQADRMVQIIAEATPKYVAGDFANNENVDWAVVDRRMGDVLSAEQLASWTQSGLRDPKGYRSREELEMEAVYERVMAEEKKARDSTVGR